VANNEYVKRYRKIQSDSAAARAGKSERDLVAERQATIAKYAPGLVSAVQKADAFVEQHPKLPGDVIFGPVPHMLAEGWVSNGDRAVDQGIIKNPISPVGQYVQHSKDQYARQHLSDRARYEYDYQKELDAVDANLKANQPQEQAIDLDEVQVTDEDRARAKEAARKALK
jgi:hypothetical protein